MYIETCKRTRNIDQIAPETNKLELRVSLSVQNLLVTSVDNPRRHGGVDPLPDSKVRVVELSGKYQQISLDEYPRLMARFLILSQNWTKL